MLAAGGLEATFLPDVGMLGMSLRHRGDELLALPGGVAAYRAGHQTGLPLLAPWANRLGDRRYRVGDVDVDLTGLALGTDEHGLPIHGTLTASSDWQAVAVEASRLVAELEHDTPELLGAFPFPHRLQVVATIGVSDHRVPPPDRSRRPEGAVTLTITTTLTPTGGRAVPVSFGWHPYLRLPGWPRDRWLLHLPACEHLELDDSGLPTGRSQPMSASDDPVGGRTFDDLFALGDDRELALSDGRRRLAVRCGEGYPYAQVFAPPGREFVCLEPMTAPTNALVTGGYRLVPPGDRFTAVFSIEVREEQ